MRNYQRKKDNPYYLPSNVYRRAVYFVRDYDRLLKEQENIIYGSPPKDDMPKRSEVGDPTASKAILMERISSKINTVDSALRSIPVEYQTGVLNHVRYGTQFPDVAHRNTWFMWQARFLFRIAELTGDIL